MAQTGDLPKEKWSLESLTILDLIASEASVSHSPRTVLSLPTFRYSGAPNYIKSNRYHISIDVDSRCTHPKKPSASSEISRRISPFISVWPHLAMFGHVWLHLHRYVWLCLAMWKGLKLRLIIKLLLLQLLHALTHYSIRLTTKVIIARCEQILPNRVMNPMKHFSQTKSGKIIARRF